MVGEISDFTKSSNGHIYFNLKDNKTSLKAVYLKPFQGRASFIPKNGNKVKVIGEIDTYSSRSEYQIKIRKIELFDDGDFLKQFRELYSKLELEGFFKEENKKYIPKYPQKIAVLTSDTGAAIDDFLVTAKKHFAVFSVDFYPVPIQGEKAISDIVKAIKLADSKHNSKNNSTEYDSLVLMRGGGSIDDLSIFNDERIARALFATSIPTISAIGHERDISISDYVADKRAETPTAAAVLLSQSYYVASNEIKTLQNKILAKIIHLYDSISQSFDNTWWKIEENSPFDKISNFEIRVEYYKKSIINNMELYLSKKLLKMDVFKNLILKNPYLSAISYKDIKEQKKHIIIEINNKIIYTQIILNNILSRVKAMNPDNILSKGYSIVYKGKKILSDTEDLAPGDSIYIKMKKGHITSSITSVED